MIAYLPKSQHDQVRKAPHDAYDQETYKAAKAALEALKPSLALMNASALNSLEEGLEGTLTLHRLGLMAQLQAILSHHQLYRIPQRDGGTAHPKCQALEQLRSAISVAGNGTPGYRTKIAENQRVPLSISLSAPS